jgi:hypothetical protein
MKTSLFVVLCALLWCASAEVQAGVHFPKEKDLKAYSTACGGGVTDQEHRTVARAVKDWKSDSAANVDTESAHHSLATVMEQVTSSEGGNNLYKKYIACVQYLIDKYLDVNNPIPEPVNPWSDVAGFLSIGATYGSIRTGSGPTRTNDNQPIGLARLGYWFNNHIAFGLEASYWQRKDVMAATGLPFRTSASTAVLPLYIHFGRRFPFTMYFGAGRGWESNEFLVPGANGPAQQRVMIRDVGPALVAGAGFEFAWTQHVSVSVLARGIRTKINTLPNTAARPERDVLSAGVAFSMH